MVYYRHDNFKPTIMRILITGGAGFIGSHLAEALVARGHRVSIFDDLSTGSLQNIKPLLKTHRVSFKKGSVLDRKILAPLITKSDKIFHLAAAVGVKLVVEKPLESMITNIDGTMNVLQFALKRKVPVLITSSSEVYGKNGSLPFREDADRVYGSAYNERWGYALSKATDEFLGLSFFREKKLPVVVVRLFNTTGPRQTGRYGMVVPRLVTQALQGEPLTIYGDGRQIRSFSYVGDIVRGMILLMNSKRAYGQIFNLGSDEPISINGLARRIKTLTKSASSIKYISYEQAYNKTFEDMRRRVPDISKARAVVGYKPTYTLDRTLKAIIAFYRALA